MNNWDRIKELLDDTFGFSWRSNSELHMMSHKYDEESNQHILHLEYRALMPAAAIGPCDSERQGGMELLRQILNDVQALRAKNNVVEEHMKGNAGKHRLIDR